MVCVGLSERDLKNFWGATGGARQNFWGEVVPPNENVWLRPCAEPDIFIWGHSAPARGQWPPWHPLAPPLVTRDGGNEQAIHFIVITEDAVLSEIKQLSVAIGVARKQSYHLSLVEKSTSYGGL